MTAIANAVVGSTQGRQPTSGRLGSTVDEFDDVSGGAFVHAVVQLGWPDETYIDKSAVKRPQDARVHLGEGG